MHHGEAGSNPVTDTNGLCSLAALIFRGVRQTAPIRDGYLLKIGLLRKKAAAGQEERRPGQGRDESDPASPLHFLPAICAVFAVTADGGCGRMPIRRYHYPGSECRVRLTMVRGEGLRPFATR